MGLIHIRLYLIKKHYQRQNKLVDFLINIPSLQFLPEYPGIHKHE